MTDKATLLALADRVEALDGPCRKTDGDIALALQLPWDYSVSWRGWGFDRQGNAIERPVAFPYTASIDAAITLVPKGCMWNLGGNPIGGFASGGIFGSCVWEGADQIHGESSTPALALTAAALRALAKDAQ